MSMLINTNDPSSSNVCGVRADRSNSTKTTSPKPR